MMRTKMATARVSTMNTQQPATTTGDSHLSLSLSSRFRKSQHLSLSDLDSNISVSMVRIVDSKTLICINHLLILIPLLRQQSPLPPPKLGSRSLFLYPSLYICMHIYKWISMFRQHKLGGVISS